MIRKIGFHLKEDHTGEAVVWAPFCKKVDLEIIKPQRKLVNLHKDAFGYWRNRVEAEEGSLYFFRLDDGPQRPDPASLSQPQGVHGPSRIIRVKRRKWKDHEWKNVALSKIISYELHIGTFTREGTFDAAIKKLRYLKDLGVNAIEIMPVAQYPGSRNWGYDGVYPFAVQESYGGVDGLQNLVEACHLEGIAVILDVVYNHMGPEGNYLSEYGPYFTDKYKTPWGQALNFDDAYCDEVRNFFIQNAMMWFEDFHIDGLRLDAVHAIKDLSPHHFIRQLAEETARLSDRLGIRKYLIAEIDLNDARFIQPFEIGGYGAHVQWIDEFHHAIHALVTGEKAGYYSDFGSPEQLVKAYNEAYVYSGNYSSHRKKFFGSDASARSFSQFMVFSQNHDQVGNRMLGDRLSTLIPFEALKLVAGAYLLSPYIPLIFMGEEYGEKRPFQYFVSHTDDELVEAVRKGRKNEFKDFQNAGETPDPQSEETFNRSKLSWETIGKDSAALLKFYKALILFRKSHAVFEDQDRKSLKAWLSKNQNIIVHKSCREGEDLLMVLNFSKSENMESLSMQGKWNKAFASAEIQWEGPGPDLPEAFTSILQIAMKPYSIAVYTRKESQTQLQSS